MHMACKVTQTCFFRAYDPVELLARLCDVIGAQDELTLPSTPGESRLKSNPYGATEGLAPQVLSLLRRHTEGLVGDIISKVCKTGPPGGPGKRALKTIQRFAPFTSTLP